MAVIKTHKDLKMSGDMKIRGGTQSGLRVAQVLQVGERQHCA